MQALSGRSVQLAAHGRHNFVRPASSLLVCRASSEAASKVTFKIQHHVDYGQQLCLTGCADAIGQWDPKQALLLEWSDGDVWHAEAEIPVGAKLEYKFIIKQGAALHWQQGANKGVTVPNAAAVEVLDSWSQAQTNFKIVDDSPAAITAQQEGTEGQETYLESQESTSEELASQQEQLEAQEQDTASRIEKAQQVARSYDYEHPEILHKAVETLENIGADTEAVGTPAKAPADMGGKGLKLANNIVTGLPAGMGVPVSASPAAQGGAVALDDYDKGAILDDIEIMDGTVTHYPHTGGYSSNNNGTGKGATATLVATKMPMLRAALEDDEELRSLTRGRTGPHALDHVTTNELRAVCKRRGRPSNGSRKMLISRLQGPDAN